MAELTPEEIRAAALVWIDQVTLGGTLPVTRDQLANDFLINGQRFALIDRGKGIRKPAGWQSALSIVTAAPKPGRERPYDDDPADSDIARYKFRRDSGGSSENEGLRVAMRETLPLMWFVGISPGVFEAKFPVYVIDEEPEHDQVVIAVEEGMLQLFQLSKQASAGDTRSALENELVKTYAVGTARVRKHQRVFAQKVMQAYEEHCAVCKFDDRRLLDAAHIIPDRFDAGIPAVTNGLALCKIHHAAYDNNMLGISPDLEVQINIELLHKIDGPMLKHGLQEHHGQQLMFIPAVTNQRPDPDALAWRFRHFQQVQQRE